MNHTMLDFGGLTTAQPSQFKRKDSLRRWLRLLCLGVALCSGTALVWEYADSPRAAMGENQRCYAKKNIEEICVGDVVMAWDEQGRISAPKKVTRVYHRVADHERVLRIRAETTVPAQDLRTTDEHPFYVKGQGWVKAGLLKPGDEIRQYDGHYGQVEVAARKEWKKGIAVYNIETEDFHTYFVAQRGSRGPPVLVHNCNTPRVGNKIPKAVDNAGKPVIGQQNAKPNTNANLVQQNQKGNAKQPENKGGVPPANPARPPNNPDIANAPAGTGDIYVIGRQIDTAVARDWPGHQILDIPQWTIARNDAWIQSIINQRARVYIGSPTNQSSLVNATGGETVFARELRQLIAAGYRRVGNYLIPPNQ